MTNAITQAVNLDDVAQLVKTRKYLPLARRLLAEDLDRIEVSFDEINAMIASALPPSARKYRAWWGNESGGLVQASAWLGVGWKVEEVDFSAGLVKFKRRSR